MQWLESCPAIAVWFSRLAGAVPSGVRALQVALDDYRHATTPEFDPKGTLIGRRGQADALKKLLAFGPAIAELAAVGREEAEAFVAACIDELPADERDAAWSRALCVDDPDALRQVVLAGEGLILVVGDECVHLPADARRHTIVRVVEQAAGGPGSINLSDQIGRELIDWVEKQGIERNEAFRLCQAAAGCLERVRRRFMRGGPPTPDWCRPPAAMPVAAVALLGAWDAGNAADREVAAAVAGSDYAAFEVDIAAWTAGGDPLVTRAGPSWHVHNRQTAWQRLEAFLRTQQLEAFCRLVTEVILESDPRFELPPEERWLANVHGKRRRHSETLRRALCETLLLLATRGDGRQPCYAGQRPEEWVHRAVADVFEHRCEPDFWRRVRGELSELAEAAPEPFLAAIEQDLRSSTHQVLELFENEGENGGCLHADLLWSLELLAWAPAYVGRVARVLARLAELDPGGRWSNRPFESLAAILDPRQPQCSASAPDRHRLLDALAAEHPQISAELCESLFSRNGGVLHNSHRPSMREWAPAERMRDVLVREYWADVQVAAKQLLALAGRDAKRWSALLGHLKQLSAELVESVFAEIERVHVEMLPPQRMSLRDSLRTQLHRHNQFRERRERLAWLYDDRTLDRLRRLYEALAPTDLVDRYAWLFAFWPQRPFDIEPDADEETAALELERLDAAEQLTTVGLETLIWRLEQFEHPAALGTALARTSRGIALTSQLFQQHGESEEPSIRGLVQGTAGELYRMQGEKFISEWICADTPLLSELACASLLSGLPIEPATWDIADRRGAGCACHYWTAIHGVYCRDPRVGERAARNLLDVGRPLVAIDTLAMSSSTEWLASGWRARPRRASPRRRRGSRERRSGAWSTGRP